MKHLEETKLSNSDGWEKADRSMNWHVCAPLRVGVFCWLGVANSLLMCNNLKLQNYQACVSLAINWGYISHALFHFDIIYWIRDHSIGLFGLHLVLVSKVMDIFSSWNVVVLSCRGRLLEAAPFSHFSGEIWLKGSDRVCRDGLSLPSPESLKNSKPTSFKGVRVCLISGMCWEFNLSCYCQLFFLLLCSFFPLIVHSFSLV